MYMRNPCTDPDQPVSGNGMVRAREELLATLCVPALTETLRAMGVTRIFDLDAADLTGISEEPGFHINFIQHEAVIETDKSIAAAMQLSMQAI